ncbi:hypothetical protein BCR16_08205 [Ralstonia solanacearum FJAT-1458]|nr:hypothetical protein BCR16_08205 [Ralstonia solanacearum FJAT-1458]
MDRGSHVSDRQAEETTLADLLERYLEEISPTKRSGNSDKGRVAAIKKRLGAYKLTALTPKLLAEYRDEKLCTVGPQTVVHHLALINRVLSLATREWGIVLPGGVPKVVKPKLPPGRDRRVQQGEIDAIVAATLSPVLADLVPFALETGMRRGEMLALDWEYIDFQRRTAYLPKTKTDTPRTVPLSTKALAILQKRQEAGEGVPFAMQEDAATTAFMRAVRRARDGVQNSFRRTESSKRSGCVTDDAKPDANGTLRAAWRGRFPPARGGFPSCAGLTHQSPAHHPQIAQGKQRV